MVPYTILTVTLELDATQSARAEQVVKAAFLDPQEASSYGEMADALPTLHFMSMVVFEDDHFDPLLTIEVNFDGEADPFFRALEAGYGPALRDLIRCSKRPRTDPVLYDAVTASGSTVALAPYLAGCAVTPVTPYRGARGFSRERIRTEAKLYLAVQEALGGGESYAGHPASKAHVDLRAHPEIAALLEGPAPDPQPWRPRRRDWLELGLAVLGLYVAFGLPGLIAAWLLNPLVVLAVLCVALVGVALNRTELRGLLKAAVAPVPAGAARAPRKRAVGPAKAALGFAALLLALGGLHFRSVIPGPPAVADWGGGFWASVAGFFGVFASGLAAAILVVVGLLALLRRFERTDPIHDPAVLSARSQRAIAEMAKREDRISQNHMGSLLIVKPGVLRSLLLRLGHLLLSRLARTIFADGFLGPMRTIHFAHWCILNNGARLIFFSNFDGSWDSYLSDFTEKASAGVNLAWANCIGFPEAAFLIGGGSENGRQFKAWARHSMAPTLFWFSAYRDVSVNEIHRNARVAAGLRTPSLSNPAEWAKDL